MIAFSLSRFMPLSMLLLGFCGYAGVTCMALTNTLIQSIVPDGLRGRVMSVFTLLMMGTSPMGGMFAGLIAQAIGSVPAVVAASAGLSCLIVILTLLRTPVLRRM
jgi:MFS family permease